MAHEELKKQYEEDCKNHDRPWEIWECKGPEDEHFHDFLCHPRWMDDIKYRREEPPFQPEYFSGLNWRDAEKLVGKVVEFSQDPSTYGWRRKDTIMNVIENKDPYKFAAKNCGVYPYIRTCPETYRHPTITIGGLELPRPEIEAPEIGAMYWLFTPGGYSLHLTWTGDKAELTWLPNGRIHLTEARAQAWASWWKDTVVRAVNEC